MRKLISVISAVALVASPALAADNFVVKDATGTTITKASKDTGSGVQADKNVIICQATPTTDCIADLKSVIGTGSAAAITSGACTTLEGCIRDIRDKQSAAATSLANIEADTTAIESNISTGTTRLLSAAGTSQDETAISATACTITRFTGYNASSSARYLKFYNATTANVTVGTTTPIQTFYLPATTAFSIEVQRYYDTACTFALLTAGADNSTSSVTAADILALNVDYR